MSKHYIPILVAILLISGCITKQPDSRSPVAKITGDTSAAVGNPVKLSDEGSVGNGRTWKIIPATAERNLFKIDGGVVFASNTPGTYTIILNVVLDNQLATAVHTINYGVGPEPGPNPGPNPGPDPWPDPSNWTSSVSKAVKLLAEKTVFSTGRSESARALAASMEDFCKTANDSMYPTLAEARAAMREANRDALGAKEKDWEQFNLELKSELLKYADKLATLNDYKKLWMAIAAGLRQVR